jgi:large subunit ribosomal protein L3e
MGYKSGMTHIIRELERPGSKAHKKEVCEPVSVLETPPMIVIGLVGYMEGSNGLYALNSFFAQNLTKKFRRNFYKNWFASLKKKSFAKYSHNYALRNPYKDPPIPNQYELDEMTKYASVVRVVCHSQVKPTSLGGKTTHLMEIQINGGSTADKIAFAQRIFEKAIPVEAVFQTNEMIDTVGLTKGKGTKGVISRWGVTKLPRKTHRGLRKVACVGAWHPSAIRWTVARNGQKGMHHRTEIHKKIYRLGKSREKAQTNSNQFDLTEKNITPMGGFPNYGVIGEDFIVLKGSVPGPVRRAVTLSRCLNPLSNRKALENVTLKFIDTRINEKHG